RGFNCWWDPEATRIVFRAPWPKITVTTIDISIKTNLSKTMLDELAKTQTPVAQYVTKYSHGGYMWDELAAEAWLDPSIVTKEQFLYMDISLDRGPSYGDTLVWPAGSQPGLGEQQVHILEEVNTEKLDRMFLDLMSAPTPAASLK
ncbi:MAG TPA: nucleoside hydrolase, partial [Terriglobales bacterium]|nr:nucleoside hydrolase [Terriglobales bacterium]